MMTIQLRRLSRGRRGKQRGAALVEAAVVIPVMLVFIGLIMFTHRSYSTKMDKQLGTRAGTLFYASHACKGDIPPDVVPSLDDADPGLPNGPAQKNAGKVGGSNSPGATAAVKRSNNLVKALPQDTTVGGSAIQDHNSKVGLTRQIHAASEVACNEEVFTSKWTAVFQEIGGLYKSKGGLVD